MFNTTTRKRRRRRPRRELTARHPVLHAPTSRTQSPRHGSTDNYDRNTRNSSDDDRVLSLSSSSFELELSPDPPFGVEVVGVEGALVTGVSGELVVGVEGAPITGVSVGELVVGASVGVLGVEVVGDGSLPPLRTSHDTSMFAHPNAWIDRQLRQNNAIRSFFPHQRSSPHPKSLHSSSSSRPPRRATHLILENAHVRLQAGAYSQRYLTWKSSSISPTLVCRRQESYESHPYLHQQVGEGLKERNHMLLCMNCRRIVQLLASSNTAQPC